MTIDWQWCYENPKDAAAEIEKLRGALKVADDSIRHHLRGEQIAAAMIQPHAVRAIRQALE